MTKQKGKIIIFTGPSAVGKATVEKELFKFEELKLSFSVSATTRKKRKGEVEGKHYYFLSHDEFDRKIKASEFVE
jgi:guanylate kinase